MITNNRYVEVVLPIPVEGVFTYALREQDNPSIGQRVVVQFGPRKIYTAIVTHIHNKKPSLFDAKYVIKVLNEPNVINLLQIEFWKWISSYYMSSLGDVMNVALPSFLKLASESVIVAHPDFDGDLYNLTNKEILIVNRLASKSELQIKEHKDLAELEN